MYIENISSSNKNINFRTCSYSDFMKAIDSKIVGFRDEMIKCLDEVLGKSKVEYNTVTVRDGDRSYQGVLDMNSRSLQVIPTEYNPNKDNYVYSTTAINDVIKVRNEDARDASIKSEWDGNTYLTGNSNSNDSSNDNSVSVRGIANSVNSNQCNFIQYDTGVNKLGNENDKNDGVDVSSKINVLMKRIGELNEIHTTMENMYMNSVREDAERGKGENKDDC